MIRRGAFLTISYASHVWAGFALVTAFLLYGSVMMAIWASLAYGGIIAVKEYFLDPVLETIEEAGSGWWDFFTNIGGVLLAWALYLIMGWL